MEECTKLVQENAISTLLNGLKKHKLLKPQGTNAFQKTEKLLYSYNDFKAVIEDKRKQIEEIRFNGLPERSKCLISISSGSRFGSMTEFDKTETAIMNLEESIVKMNHYVELIEAALERIRDDEYYDVIIMKYFEGATLDDMAFELERDPSTITRNKNRLINSLKVYLFPDESMSEIFD